MKLVFILILVNLCLIVCFQRRFVFELATHGARAPDSSLNEKKYDIFGHKWDGDGDLTLVGMRQDYLLGLRNRHKFRRYLSKKFKATDVYMITCDLERTLMSLQAQMQGYYPPRSGGHISPGQSSKAIPPVNFDLHEIRYRLQSWPIKEQVQVFPIHSFSQNSKEINMLLPSVCPGVQTVYLVTMNDQRIKDFCDKFLTDYEKKIRKVMGDRGVDYKFDNYFSFYYIFDTYVSLYTDDRHLHAFRKNEIDVEEFYKLSLEFLKLHNYAAFLGDDQVFLARLASTQIFRNILKMIDTRISLDNQKIGYNGYDKSKLVIYTVQEHNLASVILFLNYAFPEQNIPLLDIPFSSNLFLELRVPDELGDLINEDDYYVELGFNDNLLLKMKYLDFKKNVESNMIDDELMSTFCGWK